MTTSTCGGRGFFWFDLDGVADAWPAGQTPTSLHAAALDGIDLESLTMFSRQGASLRHLKNLKVRELGLVMQAPAEGPSFVFLQNITVWARAEGLPDVPIGGATDLADATNYVGLGVEDVDLAPYARRAGFGLYGTVGAALAPANDVQLRLVSTLEAFVAQPTTACGQR